MKMMRLFLGSLAIAGLVLTAPRLYTFLRFDPRIVPAEAAPEAPVAIVFGAGLRRDGGPTAVLYDRVATAAALYHAGKARTLLLSGDNRFENYNEPGAMQQAALELGVSADDIVLDYAGRRTYDTCYRAQAVFGVTQALLVTQSFHLPRALFICEALGLSATGVSADQRTYRRSSLVIWNAREVVATAAAWWDVTIARPLPVLGEPLPIQ